MNSEGNPDSDPSTAGGARSRPTLEDLADAVSERQADRRSNDEGSEGDPVEEPTDTTPAEEPPESHPAPPEDGDESKIEAILDVVGGRHESLLLLGPHLDPVEYDLCSRLLVAPSDDTENLLLVTNAQRADERISLYQGYLDHFPPQTAVLSVGDVGRTASRETISVGEDRSIDVVSITDPTDLMRLGIVISKLTAEWDVGRDSVVCFHSLTPLIEGAVDITGAFRFTHILLSRLEKADIRVHFHMDPSAHDQETLDTFTPLFDEVVSFEEDGTVEIAE